MSDIHAEPPAKLSGQPVDASKAGYLSAALAGDQTAFELLTESHRREILTHCYRILGSIEDAEDLVQETFLRAWRRLDTYEGRASFRAWLYKIATNACLDALDRRPKRALPPALYAAADPHALLPVAIQSPIWLEPFPDEFLAPIDAGPEARFEAHESITLSFLAALQILPPRQRCVLILSDVLDWHASEIADPLGISLSSVNSLLHRTRTTLEKNYPAHQGDFFKAEPDTKTKVLLDRYVHAWESADIDEFVSLLKEDAIFPMPPLPLWFQGRSSIREFVSATILEGDARGRWRLAPVRASGQHGFAWYQYDKTRKRYQAYAIQVVTIADNLIAEMITFIHPALFRFFDLPAELPA